MRRVPVGGTVRGWRSFDFTWNRQWPGVDTGRKEEHQRVNLRIP